MIFERGKVIELRGGDAVVESMVSGACDTCTARHACVSLGGTARMITMKNTLSARPGDMVEFTLDEKCAVLSSMILHIAPLILLIAGMIIGYHLHQFLSFDRDLSTAIGGLAGIVLYMIIIFVANPYIKKKTVFISSMTIIIPRGKSVKNLNNNMSCSDNNNG